MEMDGVRKKLKVSNSSIAKLKNQMVAHEAEMDQVKVHHKEEIRVVRKELSKAVFLRQQKIDTMESELTGYIDMYSGMIDEYAAMEEEAREKDDKLGRLSNTAHQRLAKMRDYRSMYRASYDQSVIEREELV